jgi:UDP-GlcNAc:undecaprenyl-phosphate GlcNAc-1-phosphate transferase
LTPFYLGVFAFSLLLSFILTRTVRGFTTARGWVAPPAPGRHLHETALPRLGGVAIYFTFLSSVAVAVLASRWFPSLGSSVPLSNLVRILVPGTLVFLLGIYDDVRSLGAYKKFAVQALAGAMLFAGGLRILDLPVLFGARHFGWATGLVVTILWVIGITNAFNLSMDSTGWPPAQPCFPRWSCSSWQSPVTPAWSLC